MESQPGTSYATGVCSKDFPRLCTQIIGRTEIEQIVEIMEIIEIIEITEIIEIMEIIEIIETMEITAKSQKLNVAQCCKAARISITARCPRKSEPHTTINKKHPWRPSFFLATLELSHRPVCVLTGFWTNLMFHRASCGPAV